MSVAIDFSNKVVLVTGGTRGIGRGIARRFLDAGASVVVCGRNAPDSLPERCHFIACDVRDPDSVQGLMAEIGARFGRLDVLVNNAGGSPHADAATASPRFSEGIIRLNLIAPLLVAQSANRLMQQQAGGGVQLFITSVGAHRPSPGTAAYGAAKAGVINLVSSLAIEWAPAVRVMAVSPGLVKTEQSALHYGDAAGIERVAATIPLARMAEPEDIGNACLFMASDLASYASGTHLLLHGGGEKPAFLAAAAQ